MGALMRCVITVFLVTSIAATDGAQVNVRENKVDRIWEKLQEVDGKVDKLSKALEVLSETQAADDARVKEDKVDRIWKKLNEVDEKIDKLSGSLKSLSGTIDGGQEDQRSSTAFPHTTPGHSLSTNPSGKGHGSQADEDLSASSGKSLVSIQEIRREPLGHGVFQYVVRYTKNVDKVTCRTVNVFSEDIVTVMDDNGDEARVTVNESLLKDKSSSFWFVFSDKDNTTGMALAVGKPSEQRANVSESQTITLTAGDIKSPWLELDSPYEIVYSEGEDVDITVTADKGLGETLYRQFLYDHNTGELMQNFTHLKSLYDPFESMNATDGGEKHNVTVKTSEGKLSGIVEFMRLNLYYDPKSLIRYMIAKKIVQIKPEGESHPFPEEVIGFFGTEDKEKGGQVSYCDMNRAICSQDCLAIGGAIDDVTVSRIQPDGKLLPVQTFYWYDNKYLKERDFRFTPPSTLQSNGDTSQKFICEARNSLGQFATRVIIVEYFMSSEILEDTHEFLTDYGNQSTIVLECTARGYPLPNVTFSLFFSYESLTDQPADETSISQDGLTIKANKTYTWTNRNEYGDRVDLMSASCGAESKFAFDSEEIFTNQNYSSIAYD